MKKYFLTYFCIFLIACEEKETTPNPYEGEILIEKMVTTNKYLLTYPKPNTTTGFLVKIEGILKNDVIMQLYTPNGDRLILERIIMAGAYNYKERQLIVDYYEADNILLKLVPAKGSEETFKLKWSLGG